MAFLAFLGILAILLHHIYCIRSAPILPDSVGNLSSNKEYGEEVPGAYVRSFPFPGHDITSGKFPHNSWR